MAILAANVLTLADWSKRLDPNGQVPAIANLLSQTNEILTDAVFKEGNLPTGHRFTQVTSLPTVYTRAINQGILPSKATTAQIDSAQAMFEARNEMDKDLAMLNGNTAAFRLSESRLFLEAMNQTVTTQLFYGDPTTDPKTFLGLAPQYNAISGAANGQNVIDGGGAGGGGSAYSSVWLICWGEDTAFCHFPKGSKAGLQRQDLGEQTIYEVGGVAGTRMQALVDWYQWKIGLAIKDWRYVVRIPNLLTTEWTLMTGSAAPNALNNLLHTMTRAYYRIPSPDMGRCAFYMNRSVHSVLARMAMEKSAPALAIEEGLTQFGTPMRYLSFLGVPIRRCDAILNTETRIT